MILIICALSPLYFQRKLLPTVGAFNCMPTIQYTWCLPSDPSPDATDSSFFPRAIRQALTVCTKDPRGGWSTLSCLLALSEPGKICSVVQIKNMIWSGLAHFQNSDQWPCCHIPNIPVAYASSSSVSTLSWILPLGLSLSYHWEVVVETIFFSCNVKTITLLRAASEKTTWDNKEMCRF